MIWLTLNVFQDCAKRISIFVLIREKIANIQAIRMTLNLIDSHTHAEWFIQQGMEQEMRERAIQAGIVHAVNVGTGTKDWQLYAEAAAAHPGFYSYSTGLHPCSVDQNWEAELETMLSFLNSPVGPVAWGEMGLDYFHLPSDQAEAETLVGYQKQAFRQQLAMVKDSELPVIIHSRNAFVDTVDMIDQSGVDWARIVFHCFTFGPEEMKVLVEKGGRASFTGILTYSKTEAIREAMRLQGLERLMLETDAPWLSPQPVRKHKNEPAYLVHVAEEAARQFAVSVEELAERTTRNACDFFQLEKHIRLGKPLDLWNTHSLR